MMIINEFNSFKTPIFQLKIDQFLVIVGLNNCNAYHDKQIWHLKMTN
jgi:hypothetical protein